ncbi:21 kDa hemolysin precursor [hydrothermal vent metagenome]|uniref:21 kDa hemolysin n=1 Tax=hydrothermal vent metagenome TaxID=652676 RepID=A0A1W1DS16_9ZZZZ
MKKTLLLSTLILSSIFLSGCIVSTASTVSTVVSVTNERRTTGEMIDDKTIGLRLLAWSTEGRKLGGAHVNFMSFDRVVLATGEAPSNDLRSYILKQVQIIDPKVKSVINEIVVGPNSGYLSRIKDAAITTQVEILFQDQEVFHPTHVKVMTENQTVYLMGKVTKREANKAATTAAKAKGVRRIVKLFDYLKTRPTAEIESDRKRELKDQKAAEFKKQQAELDAKKAELKKQLRALGGNTEGTSF